MDRGCYSNAPIPPLAGLPLDRDSSFVDAIFVGLSPQTGSGFRFRPVCGHFQRNGVYTLDLRHITGPEVERFLCTYRYLWLHCFDVDYPTVFMSDELRYFTPVHERTSLTTLERKFLSKIARARHMSSFSGWAARDCGGAFCCASRVLAPPDIPLGFANGLVSFGKLVWWPGAESGPRVVSTRETIAGVRLLLQPPS